MQLINIRPTFDISRLRPKIGGVAYYDDDANNSLWNEKKLADEVSRRLRDLYTVIYAEIPRNGKRVYYLKRVDSTRISIRVNINK
jgi:hypothetical protein